MTATVPPAAPPAAPASGGLRIRGLGFSYPNGHRALADADLDVAPGEFVALVGPSGSGKTTLLRLLAGFLAPSAGTIEFDGATVAGPAAWVPPERRRLGMVFQDHAVWPHWSVRRNIGYPLRLAGVRGRELRERVDHALALVGLGELGDRMPAALSGGQRQRVALARALVAEPVALLLDEALSALDEPLRARLRLELVALTRSAGLTTVHVTHDRAEALALADRIVVLDHGRIEQIGTPEELLAAPRTPFVARFLADAALYEGVRTGAGVRMRCGDAELTVPEARLRLADDVADGEPVLLAATPDDTVLRAPGCRDAELPDAADAAAAAGAAPAAGFPTTAPDAADRASVTHGIPATADAPSAHGTVRASLFVRGGRELQVECGGRMVRGIVQGWSPAIGDPVEVAFTRLHCFAAG